MESDLLIFHNCFVNLFVEKWKSSGFESVLEETLLNDANPEDVNASNNSPYVDNTPFTLFTIRQIPF